MTRARVLALVVAGAVAGCGGSGGAGGHAVKVQDAAAAYASGRMHLSGFTVSAAKRSRVDGRWVLVAGFAKLGPGGRPGPVALWLTRSGTGWEVRRSGAGPGRLDPAGVPCDLHPAFARPRC
jgi:hypothetical protein